MRDSPLVAREVPRMQIMCIRAIAALVILTFSLPLVGADHAVVLMYHRFGEDQHPSTNIRVEQVEAQIDLLREGGFAVIPLADVLNSLNGQGTLPPRAVVITIDDAYRSVHEVAFPRFKAAGFPFTVFVATDPVDKGLPDFMTWDQMREMSDAGATFANHGASHDSLIHREVGEDDSAWQDRVRADVKKGWTRLNDELDPLPGVFAFPYGEYNEDVAGIVADMGYLAFGQQSGALGPATDRRALPRFAMAEAFGDISEFRTKVKSLPMPVVAVDPWDPVVSVGNPIVEVTLGEVDGRLDELACFVGGQGRVQVEWLTPRERFRVGPEKPIGEGRHRVNCTVPGPDGRYLWFSHPWIVQKNKN